MTLVQTKFFEFAQNNTGGSGKYHIDPASGIGQRVWIEAADATHANAIAERLGLYFDGAQSGRDCPCCGDRWSRARDSEALAAPEDPGFVHYLSGRIGVHV
jgi:hypothetical protein